MMFMLLEEQNSNSLQEVNGAVVVADDVHLHVD